MIEFGLGQACVVWNSFLRSVIPEKYRPISYLTSLVRKRTGDRIRSGPFSGMRYPNRAVNSAYLPKLLGIYEREINWVIEDACAWRPQIILDLGAAEGYYAAGLAQRNPTARVIAFEQDHLGRFVLRQTLTLNGVEDRVQIEAGCIPTSLNVALRASQEKDGTSVTRRLVLCDVEGEEHLLLDPAVVPNLMDARILVEVHEYAFKGVTGLLMQRFNPTHWVQQIWQQPRSTGDFPFRTIWTTVLPSPYLRWAVSEWRPCRMSWLWMKPKARLDKPSGQRTPI